MTETAPLDELEKQARKLFKQRKFTEAIDVFQKVIEEDEVRSAAHIGVATAAYSLKNYELSETHFKRASQLVPANGTVLINLGAVYNKLGKYLDAAGALRKGLLKDRKSVEGHFNIAFANRNLKQNALAVSSYKEVIRLDPEFVEAYVNLGEIYIEMGNYQQSKIQLEKALELNPNHKRALKTLEEATAAAETAKNAISPFGRLVTEAQLAENKQTVEHRELTETERINDRRVVFDLTRDIESLTSDFVKSINRRFEDKLVELNKAVQHESEAPTELYTAARQFKEAFRTFKEFHEVLRAKTDELHAHEKQTIAPN